MKVLTSGASAVVIQAAGVALAFLVQLLLASMLGAEMFGIFAFYFSLAVIFGTWGRLGSDAAVMRIGGEASASGIRMLRQATQHGLRIALVGGAIGSLALVGLMLATGASNTHAIVAILAAALVLPVSINGVRQAALLAVGRINIALMPDAVLRPSLAIIVLPLVLSPGMASPSGAEAAIAVMLASAITTSLVLWLLTNRLIPAANAPPVDGESAAQWTRLGLALMTVNASYLLVYHSDTILLGLKLSPESIGPYQIAKQISQIGLFAMIAVQFAFSPRMAAMVAGQQWNELRRLFRATVWMGAGFAAATLVVFALAGRWVVTLFGAEFAVSYELALVLLASQLIIALVGPVGVLASMSGNQYLATTTYIGGAILMFAAGPMFIEFWGLMGAALAQGTVSLLCAAIIAAGIMRRIPIWHSVAQGVRQPPQ